MSRFLSLNKKIILGLLFGFIVFTSFKLPAVLAEPKVDFKEETTINSEPIIFEPQVTIPGSEFKQDAKLKLEASTAPIAKYISAIYNYGVGIVGILAAMMLMIGGIIWLTAAGSSTKVEQAKSFIGSSLTGMALVLTAYILLNAINPDLVNFRVTTVTQLEELKCCELNGVAAMTYPGACKGKKYDRDYVVSLDKKTCQVGGCCIAAEINNSLVGSLIMALSTDQMADTKLSYKSALVSECNVGSHVSTVAILTAGVFGSTKENYYIDLPCPKVQMYACLRKNNSDICLGKSRFGYCYGGICSTGLGNEHSFCGGSDSNGAGECFATTKSCIINPKSGLKCTDGLKCCLVKLTDNVYHDCATAELHSMCHYTTATREGPGYCGSETVGKACLPCSKYGERCVSDLDCPDFQFDKETNPGQSCGVDDLLDLSGGLCRNGLCVASKE